MSRPFPRPAQEPRPGAPAACRQPGRGPT